MTSLLYTSNLSPVNCGARAVLGSSSSQSKLARVGCVRVFYLFSAKLQLQGHHRAQRASVIVCRAEGRQPSVTNLIYVLSKASKAWDKYDKDKNGTMSLKECEDIFNSKEITEAFESLTNVSHRVYTIDDLAPYFKRADRDASGTLTRTEFLALYLAVIGDRVKRNPLLLAEVLLGFIDNDRNGVLEGKELKRLLAILGIAPALFLPIPDFVKVNYRDILQQAGGILERAKSKSKSKA